MARKSPPFMSKCVPKECLSEWGVAVGGNPKIPRIDLMDLCITPGFNR